MVLLDEIHATESQPIVPFSSLGVLRGAASQPDLPVQDLNGKNAGGLLLDRAFHPQISDSRVQASIMNLQAQLIYW